MGDSSETDPEFSEICTKLWNLDENFLVPGQDYEIDLQGYTKAWKKGADDFADRPLFSWISEEAFERPTFKKFIALLDNYESDTGVQEEVTEQEEAENWAFLDAIMETAVMQECHKYLVNAEKSTDDVDEFKKQLYDIWFKLYRRTRGDRDFDSSGFEHVFVGETRNKSEVTGFHNWVQFYLQEKRGNIDYKGYIPVGRSRKADPEAHLITIQFTWKGSCKPVGSTFVGTSPEFEFALYTLLFLAAPEEKTQVTIADEYNVEVICYRFGRDKIGTSYPVAMRER